VAEKYVWEPIAGFEGNYKICLEGLVKSVERIDCLGRRHPEQIMKPKHNNRGYAQISLYRNGKRHYFLLHRLVAEHFIPNPDNLPQVNHKDENKDNNHSGNLEWCTNLYNRRYGTGYMRSVEKHDYSMIGRGNRKPVNQYSKNGELICKWDAIVLAEKATGIPARSIRRCFQHRKNIAGGYRWELAAM
jgi:hypothetical protein